MEVVPVIVLNFVATWFIGLLIPVVLRFVILRKPLGRTWAVVITCVVFIFNVLLFTYIRYLQEGYSSDGEISYVQGFIALAAYYILRRPKGNKANDFDTHVQNASLNPKPHKSWQFKPVAISFIILAFIAFVAGAFYWYEWRPAQIRRVCQIKADEYYNSQPAFAKYYDLIKEEKVKKVYEDCLHTKGL